LTKLMQALVITGVR